MFTLGPSPTPVSFRVFSPSKKQSSIERKREYTPFSRRILNRRTTTSARRPLRASVGRSVG